MQRSGCQGSRPPLPQLCHLPQASSLPSARHGHDWQQQLLPCSPLQTPPPAHTESLNEMSDALKMSCPFGVGGGDPLSLPGAQGGELRAAWCLVPCCPGQDRHHLPGCPHISPQPSGGWRASRQHLFLHPQSDGVSGTWAGGELPRKGQSTLKGGVEPLRTVPVPPRSPRPCDSEPDFLP